MTFRQTHGRDATSVFMAKAPRPRRSVLVAMTTQSPRGQATCCPSTKQHCSSAVWLVDAAWFGGGTWRRGRLEGQIDLGSRGPSFAALVRGGGMVLAVGGLLFVVATVLHPSQETPVTILEMEARLVSSHAVYIVSYALVLLGLPALYSAESQRMGRLGLAGFLVTFTGTTLLAISSMFGFIAPVLAGEAPETLDTISMYLPVVVFNGFAAIGFMTGFVIWSIAVARSRVFPRWSGIFMGVGAPSYLVGFGIAQLASPAFWFVAVLGSLALGSGLARTGYRIWATPGL